MTTETPKFNNEKNPFTRDEVKKSNHSSKETSHFMNDETRDNSRQVSSNTTSLLMSTSMAGRDSQPYLDGRNSKETGRVSAHSDHFD